MSETLVVLLGEVVAGTLHRLRGGTHRFDYDDDYRLRPDATPLSLSMPHQVRSHADRVVTPWLWGLLPDNDAVLRRWARQFHASASSPFSLLATPVGEDCAGAVSFVRPEAVERALAREGSVDWLSDAEVAQRLRDLREDATSWLGRPASGHFSLAGAQAKTALLHDGRRWGVPSGATPTSHILKPAVAGLDEHDLNEHLCLDAAARVGLVVADPRVGRFEDQSAIVVRRYDRVRRDDALLRVHQEDVCQALAVHPTRKYQNEGGPSPADVAGLFRRAMPPQAADDALWRFAEALAWNWLIVGTDAHAKNYSLLLAGDQVRLAPLYDIASALPYGLHERELRFAMKLGGDYRVSLFSNPWATVARELSVDSRQLIVRVRELAARLPDAFADAGTDSHVSALESDLPRHLTDLVAGRARRCLALLDAGGE